MLAWTPRPDTNCCRSSFPQSHPNQTNDSHTGKGDSSITEEPAAATALLLSGAAAGGAGAAATAAAALGAGGADEEPRWRKRSSYMSAVERVKRLVLWRASQAVARGHQGTGVPEVAAVEEVPGAFRLLLAEVVEVSCSLGSSFSSSVCADTLAALHTVVRT